LSKRNPTNYGLSISNSIGLKTLAASPFVKAVTPWVTGAAKAVAAFTGGYQGGVQLRQAWTGEGADGRQLSAPERFVAGVNGIATIATTFLSLRPAPAPKPQTECFVAGTQIQTLNGTKNIEDIQVGDWVLSDDPNTVGEIVYKQVLNTFVKQTSSLIDVYIDGEKITTTEEHPFWVPDVGWVAAKDLQAGSYLQTKYESWLDVDLVVKRSDTATVYNFEVQGFHTYFVSDLGLLVHNQCELTPWTPEHKAQRWKDYQNKGGAKDYDAWSNSYDNIARNKPGGDLYDAVVVDKKLQGAYAGNRVELQKKLIAPNGREVQPDYVFYDSKGNRAVLGDAKSGAIEVDQGKNLISAATETNSKRVIYYTPDGNTPIPPELQREAARQGVRIQQIKVSW
jgi:Pretoxin HINT domain